MKAMWRMRPSDGFFLNSTPSFSRRSHSASTSSHERAMWPKPARRESDEVSIEALSAC